MSFRSYVTESLQSGRLTVTLGGFFLVTYARRALNGNTRIHANPCNYPIGKRRSVSERARRPNREGDGLQQETSTSGPTPGDGGHRPGQSRMGNCSAATRLSERAGVPNKVDGQCTYRNGKYCNYAYLNCFLFKKTNKQKDISGKHVFKLTRPALVIPRKLLNFGPCFFFPPREVT